MTLLELHKVAAKIEGVTIVKDVSFALKRGEVTALVGPNGSGKTTLLRAIPQLIQPSAGEVRIDGRPVAQLSRQERAKLIAYLPQGQALHWPLNVERLVALGRMPHLSPWQAISESDEAAVWEAMELCDALDFTGRSATTLSGGERARVMLARAICVGAPLLLADEPTAALDPYHQLQVMELLRSYAQQGAAVLVVLHDLSLAARFCDQAVLLDQGEVSAVGAPEAVLSAERLAAVYHVEALTEQREGQAFVLPWRRL